MTTATGERLSATTVSTLGFVLQSEELQSYAFFTLSFVFSIVNGGTLLMRIRSS